jgi:uncharacterized membrane protein
MHLRFSGRLRRMLLAAAAPVPGLRHMVAAIHPAIAVAVGAAIALLGMAGHLAVLVVGLAILLLVLLMLVVALMLRLRRRRLGGGGRGDHERKCGR